MCFLTPVKGNNSPALDRIQVKPSVPKQNNCAVFQWPVFKHSLRFVFCLFLYSQQSTNAILCREEEFGPVCIVWFLHQCIVYFHDTRAIKVCCEEIIPWYQSIQMINTFSL